MTGRLDSQLTFVAGKTIMLTIFFEDTDKKYVEYCRSDCNARIVSKCVHVCVHVCVDVCDFPLRCLTVCLVTRCL